MKQLYFTILISIVATIMAFGQGTPGNLPSSINTVSQSVTPSSSVNHVVSTTYLQAKTSHSSTYKAGETAPVVKYFDAMGRPFETVEVKASQSGSDMVSYQTYDAAGRPDKQYLPYPKSTTNKGVLVSKTTFTSGQKSFLTTLYGSTDDDYGFAQTAYEASPLNRALGYGAPGYNWQINQHSVTIDLTTNTSTVSSYAYTLNQYPIVSYAASSLFVKITTDEDGKTIKEYTDKKGQLIQKEVDGMKTRYCYDKLGLLRCVMQPKATSPTSTNSCFYYNYDEHKRLIEKQIPGKDKEYFVYDIRNRLVLWQDGNLGNQGKWQYTIYDELNRPEEQGLWSSSSNQSSLATTIESNIDYMSGRTSRIAHKYLEYDNYDMSDEIASNSDIGTLGETKASNNSGRLTMEKTILLDSETGMDTWITSTYYYDKYGRVIQTAKDNHLNGTDYTTNAYNFAGLITQTRYRHTADGTTTYTDQYNDYDHRGRIMKVRHQINGSNEVLLAGNNYNEAGSLIDKYLHSVSGGTFLQRMDYTYNIRGWLTQINSPTSFTENDKFGLQLYYNSAPSGGTALYNGNISGMSWGTPSNTNMLYRFTYDDNNRLTNADFYKSGLSSYAYDANYSYDDHGNIEDINRRNGSGSYIDQIDITYSGNQISTIKDLSGDASSTVDYPGSSTAKAFTYDANGNVTHENHKLLISDYNLLNLPKEINWSGQNKYVNYFYTFDGEKLRKTVENSGTITKLDYCGAFVYETASGARSLKYIITPEGRAVKNGSSWDYEYNLKDHLGNVRAVIHKGTNGLAEVIQERHFYPFGMEMSSLSSGSGTNKYLYNGKELENDFDLGYYDYGARFYDPALGRWHSVDPMAEDYYQWSPYNYSINNPIRFIDPDGNGVFDKVINAGKQWLARKTKEVVTQTTVALAHVAKEQAIEVAQDIEGSFYIDGSVKISGGMNKSAKVQGTGLDVGVITTEVASLSGSLDKNGFDGIGNHIGKNKEMTVEHNASAGFEGLDGSASYSYTFKAGEGVVKKRTTGSATMGIIGLGVGAKYENSQSTVSNTKHTAKIGLFSGVSFGLGGRFSVEIDTGYKLEYQKKEDEQ